MQQFGRLPWLFGALFGGVGYLNVGIGWGWILVQQHRLTTYVPVPARIVSSHIQTVSDSEGQNTYKPVIIYRYKVNGAWYDGDQVMPVGNVSESGGWASRICAKYPKGTKTSAWYSPEDPKRVYLVREAEWLPHFLALFGFIFAAIGTWAGFVSFEGSRKLRPPIAGTDGWFELREERSIGGRLRLYFIATLAWYGYIAACVVDYFAVNQHQWDTFCTIASLVGGLLGLLGVVSVWRSWRLAHDFDEALVSVSKERFQLGDSVQVRLRQEIRRPLEVEGLSLGAVCMRSDRVATGSSVSYTPATEAKSVWKSMEVDRAYPADGQILTTAELTLPADGDASTKPWQPTYPFFQWFIVLKLAAQGQPPLSVRFPIVVEGKPGDQKMVLDQWCPAVNSAGIALRRGRPKE